MALSFIHFFGSTEEASLAIRNLGTSMWMQNTPQDRRKRQLLWRTHTCISQAALFMSFYRVFLTASHLSLQKAKQYPIQSIEGALTN